MYCSLKLKKIWQLNRTQLELNLKIEGWVGLGCEKFRVGLGYQSNQPELLGWVKKIPQLDPTRTMYTPNLYP